CSALCFFFQAEDGIRDRNVTGVQTCALPIFCDFSMQQLHEKIADMNTRYYDLRREIVKAERRIAVLTERGEMWAQYNEYKTVHRSEERRVGKERRTRGSRKRYKRKQEQNGAV